MTRAWVYSNTSFPAGTYFTDLEVSTGVAAWLTGSSAVYYVVYDVARATWQVSAWGPQGAFITSLAIANSSVSWLSGNSYIAGYNSANGTWTVGAQTPAHAAFLVSTSSGNPPLFVWFTDLSLGGSSWSWN